MSNITTSGWRLVSLVTQVTAAPGPSGERKNLDRQGKILREAYNQEWAGTG